SARQKKRTRENALRPRQTGLFIDEGIFREGILPSRKTAYVLCGALRVCRQSAGRWDLQRRRATTTTTATADVDQNSSPCGDGLRGAMNCLVSSSGMRP